MPLPGEPKIARCCMSIICCSSLSLILSAGLTGLEIDPGDLREFAGLGLRLICDKLGILKLELICGLSMSGDW